MSLDFQYSHAGFLRGLCISTSYYRWGYYRSFSLSSVSVFLVEWMMFRNRCSGFICDILRRNRANLEARCFGWGSKWDSAWCSPHLLHLCGQKLFADLMGVLCHVISMLVWARLRKMHSKFTCALITGFPSFVLLPWWRMPFRIS